MSKENFEHGMKATTKPRNNVNTFFKWSLSLHICSIVIFAIAIIKTYLVYAFKKKKKKRINRLLEPEYISNANGSNLNAP